MSVPCKRKNDGIKIKTVQCKQNSTVRISYRIQIRPVPCKRSLILTRNKIRERKYFILWDIVNPQLGLGLGSGYGLGLGLDSVRGSTISHGMKYLPKGNFLLLDVFHLKLFSLQMI